MEIQSKSSIQHTNTKSLFFPKNSLCNVVSVCVYLPNGTGYQWVTGWSSGLTLRSRSTHLGSQSRLLTDCGVARVELGFLPQFTHLQDKSYSELPHRDVSNLKDSKTSNRMYTCTTSFYSLSFCRENTARHKTATAVLTHLRYHFHYQPSSLFPPYF